MNDVHCCDAIRVKIGCHGGGLQNLHLGDGHPMKASRIRIRSLLIVIALAALIMAGIANVLKRPGRPYSTVFSGLDPVALLASQPGYNVKNGTAWNVFNTSRGYAFKEWRGVITAPIDPPVRQ